MITYCQMPESHSVGEGSLTPALVAFGADNSVPWGCPVCRRMFSNTAGLYPPDVKCKPQVATIKNVCHIAKCLLGSKIACR